MGKIEISKGNRRGSLGQIKRNKKNELKCNKRHFSSFFLSTRNDRAKTLRFVHVMVICSTSCICEVPVISHALT